MRKAVAIAAFCAWWPVVFIPFILTALGWMVRIVPGSLSEDVAGLLLWPAEALWDWAGL